MEDSYNALSETQLNQPYSIGNREWARDMGMNVQINDSKYRDLEMIRSGLLSLWTETRNSQDG